MANISHRRYAITPFRDTIARNVRPPTYQFALVVTIGGRRRCTNKPESARAKSVRGSRIARGVLTWR